MYTNRANAHKTTNHDCLEKGIYSLINIRGGLNRALLILCYLGAMMAMVATPNAWALDFDNYGCAVMQRGSVNLCRRGRGKGLLFERS